MFKQLNGKRCAGGREPVVIYGFQGAHWVRVPVIFLLFFFAFLGNFTRAMSALSIQDLLRTS